jgi:hypothetical protein
MILRLSSRVAVFGATCSIIACTAVRESDGDSSRGDSVEKHPAVVSAAADVPSYVVAKRKYIAAFEAAQDSGRIPAKDEAPALADLEARLRAIIAPPSIDDTAWTINLEHIPTRGNEGGAELDGLRTRVGTARVIITTSELLAAWLRFQGDSATDPLADVASEEMLTQAFYEGASVHRFGRITVPASLPSDVFTAQLVVEAQDTGPVAPDELIVGVHRGDRVYLIKAPLAVKVPEITACRSSSHDTYDACYEEQISALPDFPKIVAQIASLATLVPNT